MKQKTKQGLEYASPSMTVFELNAESGILSGSETKKGFVVEGYEEDGEF